MKLPWAFNSATVMKQNWDEEFKLWTRFGWTAVELWYDKVKACIDKGRSAQALNKQMTDAGIRPVGLAAMVVQTASAQADIKAERDEWARRLDVTAELGCPAMTVVALGKMGDDHAAENSYLAERLRVAGDLAAARSVRINLEFLGLLPVNGTLGTCIDIIKKADHRAIGMLFDLVHYYVSASHVEELTQLPAGKLFHVHIDDSPRVPMEKLTNDLRCFPGEGRIDVPGLIKLIQKNSNFSGWYGVEIYDPRVWEADPVTLCERMAKSIAYVEANL